MATFNGAKFIKEQIASILVQLSDVDEIVVSDDSSCDKTVEIVQSFNDHRIKILSSQKFKSPIFNFENSIKNAKGNIIFLADQDDVWLPGKIKKMLLALQDYDLVISNAFIGDSNLNIVFDSYFKWRNSKVGVLKNFIKNSYLGCCMAFKREMLDILIPFPKMIPMHDMWIGMVAELYYKPIFIEDKLIIYRRHQNNATFLKDDYTSNESLISKIRFRFNLLLAIILRSIKKDK